MLSNENFWLENQSEFKVQFLFQNKKTKPFFIVHKEGLGGLFYACSVF